MNLNLDNFKSSGVYTLEIDGTAMDIQTTDSLRVAVGFTGHGPFNRPVYLASKADREKIFGKGYDTKLERRGSFFDRSLDILLSSQPVIALNLLNVDDRDKVGTTSFAMSSIDNKDSVYANIAYSEFFDRSRFWVPSKEHLSQVNAVQSGVEHTNVNEMLYSGPIFNVVNTGTSDITVFAVKDTDVAGYNVTVAKWYENESAPYAWMRPTDFISEYFVKLVAVKGDWTNLSQLASDTTWQRYFDANGLIASELDKFIKADGVSVIGTWSGCILPNFYAKNGNLVSIEDKVNKYSEQTGVMISFNTSAMEALVNSSESCEQYYDDNWDGEYNEGDVTVPGYKIDMVGHFFASGDNAKMLSYAEKTVDDNMIYNAIIVNSAEVKDNEFIVYDPSTALTIGDYVKGTNGYLVKVVKKSYNNDTKKFKFTASDAVAKVEDENGGFVVEVHRSINDFFTHLVPTCLKGLKLSNRHMPGFDADGAVNIEAGVEKIYSMLNTEGIKRGLKNRSMINFRYIIDTLAGGLDSGLGGKKHLFNIAKEVGKCTAIVNFPSVQQMTMSSDPIFSKVEAGAQPVISKTFSTDYIPTGGNPDALCSKELTLPTKDEGADYGLVFSPFLKYRSGSKTILLPPAAHAANAYIRKFNGGNPYGTVANRDGILGDSDIVGVEYMYDQQDRDNLEPVGINPIIDDNGDVMIYGNRTAYQEVLSDLNYAHVRELLNTIEIQCEDVLKKYVFKYNNEITRAEIVRRLDPILEEKLNSGALYSYNIICNSDNNTSEVINRAFGIVDIEVQITKNMEKIIQRIHLNRLEE